MHHYGNLEIRKCIGAQSISQFPKSLQPIWPSTIWEIGKWTGGTCFPIQHCWGSRKICKLMGVVPQPLTLNSLTPWRWCCRNLVALESLLEFMRENLESLRNLRICGAGVAMLVLLSDVLDMDGTMLSAVSANRAARTLQNNVDWSAWMGSAGETVRMSKAKTELEMIVRCRGRFSARAVWLVVPDQVLYCCTSFCFSRKRSEGFDNGGRCSIVE